MPSQEIALTPTKPRATPGQIRPYDNHDDRRELHRQLHYLPPMLRVQFLDWACSQAKLPGSGIAPKAAPSSWQLAAEARHSDDANDRLTMDCFLSLVHLGIDYAIDLRAALERLVEVVKRRGKRPR